MPVVDLPARFHWWECATHRSKRRSVWPALPPGGRPFAWCDESVFLAWVADRASTEECVFRPSPDQSGAVAAEVQFL